MLALHELISITEIESYIFQQDQACCLYQGRLCQGKENGRKQVLASMVPSPGADMNWITVAFEETSKQSPVTTMMQQVHNQYQANQATKTAKAKTTTASKKRKGKPKKINEKGKSRPGETVLQDTTNAPPDAKETAIGLCGCRHGDLGEVQSFAKAMATYYSRPNKFMEGRCCLDCQLAVPNMESNARGGRAVVNYGDEGIKGFDAPDDDPMKSELTCDLILCPKCEAKRRIEYNKVNSERQSRGVKRSRQQTGVQN
jgi:hypothetical protein